MSFTDALTRISDIQSQISALTTATPPTATAASLSASSGTTTSGVTTTGTSSGTTATSGATATATAGTTATSAQFAAALAQAQTADTAGADGTVTGTNADSGVTDTDTDSGITDTDTDVTDADSMLTSGQRQFASTLVADTGLNPSVVSAWLLSEESGGAAQSRQSAHNNDWLNVGYTDSGTVGGADQIWSDPVSAATATAQWLKGQDAIPGYGTASSGVQSILSSVGDTPSAQISALQNSGWASGGYPDLPSLYSEVST